MHLEPDLMANGDGIGQVCSELGLSEEECTRVREAAEAYCRLERGKNKPSEYNIFIGKCVKSEKGPVPERFKRCVEKWKREKKR